jgi:DNA-binding NarL/FixJ family response regulator
MARRRERRLMASRRKNLEDEAPPEGLVVYAAGDVALLSLPLSEDPRGALASLTHAELGVARKLVEGLTNAQIAAVRGTSERTVANQVAAIFRKLRVGSRAELARRFAIPPE